MNSVFQFAKVISVDDNFALIQTSMNEKGKINLSNLSWAREHIAGGYVGPKIVSWTNSDKALFG